MYISTDNIVNRNGHNFKRFYEKFKSSNQDLIWTHKSDGENSTRIYHNYLESQKHFELFTKPVH